MSPRRTAVTIVVAGLGFLFAGLPGGCAQGMRDKQLARVAKDWSLVVRASQVVPVYPLTEDLVPGDMFLVRMSVPRQHREYQRRGFLPMDMHLARLQGLDYAALYLDSYGTKDKSNTPYHWQFPPDGIAPGTVDGLRPPQAVTTANAGGGQTNQGNGGNPQSRRHTDSTLWPTAPRAAFPSYTFQVDSRGGIQAALPIQGVPVALSMMQTDKAFGSVTLSDTHTYGVPYDRLITSVKEWAAGRDNKETLKKIRSGVNKGNTWTSVFEDAGKFLLLDHNERTVYLRVVSRVYVVGSVTVALINTRQGAADAQIGAARNIELLNPALQAPSTPPASSPAAGGNTSVNTANADDKNADAALTALAADPNQAANAFQQALEAVNANLGGAVKLRWATARSVALDEAFPRPLVIGYLGFDYPINEDGSLGTPIATQHQLEGRDRAGQITGQDITSVEYGPDVPALRNRIERWFARDRAANVPGFTAWLKNRGIDIPAGMWVRSKAASAQDLSDAIRDLNIPE